MTGGAATETDGSPLRCLAGGVQCRLLVAIGALIVAYTGITTWTDLSARARLIEAEHARSARLVTSVLATALPGAFTDLDLERMRQLLADIRAQEGVEDACAVSASGRILADGTEANARRDQVLDDMAIRQARGSGSCVEERAGDALIVTEPVLLAGEPIGLVRVTFGTAEAAGRADEMRWRAAGSALAFLCAALLVVFVLLRSITRPLAELVAATQSVARGRFEERIQVAGPDEVRTLASAFNRMTSALQSSVVSQRYVDNVIGSMREALFVAGPDGRIRTANPAALELLGATRDELRGRPIGSLFDDPRFRHLSIPRDGAAAHGDVAVSGECALLAAGGRRVPVAASVALLRDEGGAVEGVVCVAHDVTEMQRARQELERSNQVLARATSEARAAERAKADFLANMSHEIRTPMNGVMGMAEMLLATPLDPDQRECAETIRLSSENLLGILNDVLDVSKIEAGKLRLESIDFDLREGVHAAVDVLAERAQGRGLELVVRVADDVPERVRGDPVRLGQVLTNLVSNAVKFTDAGEVEVTVELAASDARAATVRCSVRDTGIGIPQDAQRRLFQAFSQVDGSTTRRFGGTGLGLLICAQLVERMDGEIGVTSAEGQGSTFWFTARLQPAAAGGAQRSPRVDGAGRRALVLDDNAAARRAVCDVLQARGFETECAADPAAAAERLRVAAQHGRPFWLALLDLTAPGAAADGLERLDGVRAACAAAGTRAFLLGSLAQRARLGAQPGADAFLSKPLRAARLDAALRVALGEELPARDALAAIPSLVDTRVRARPRVLVAEDNPVNQRVALKMLELLGARVDVAANGREAVAAAAAGGYELVLMDCHMPELDGYEAARAIRAAEAGGAHRVPIVALTASALSGDRERCLAAGMDDYVTKPFRSRDLARVLERWVPGLPPARAPEPA